MRKLNILKAIAVDFVWIMSFIAPIINSIFRLRFLINDEPLEYQ
jgi:hypothetical protein